MTTEESYLRVIALLEARRNELDDTIATLRKIANLPALEPPPGGYPVLSVSEPPPGGYPPPSAGSI